MAKATDKCKRQWEVGIGGYHGEDVIAECGCKRYTGELCPGELDRWEIDRRINAVERLSAEDARHIIEFWDNSTSMRTVADTNLRAYADILEKEE